MHTRDEHFWKDILPETAFYSPNAPFSTDFGPDSYQWFDLLKRTKDEMKDGLAKSGPYLNNYIEEILNENNLDIHKLLVVGFSQGTIMALDHMSKRSSPCAGVIGYSGMFFEDEDCQKNIQCKKQRDRRRTTRKARPNRDKRKRQVKQRIHRTEKQQ